MMNGRSFFAFLLIGIVFTCGCATYTPTEQKISDDDLYLQSLNDFVTAFASTNLQQSNAQFSKEQMGFAEWKIRATTYHNRVSSLKVSSNFEFSKNSFLQSLSDLEAIADFQLTHSSDEQMRFVVNPSSMTAAQKQEYNDGAMHNQNFGLFYVKTFDNNVCMAAENKYTNVTAMCKAIQTHTK
jgi:hypothetical protein